MNNISKVESVAPVTKIHSPSYPCTCNIDFEGNSWSISYCQIHGNAPALLAACQRALPWIGRMIADKGHEKCVMLNDCIRTMQLLEAAISKAEGRL